MAATQTTLSTFDYALPAVDRNTALSLINVSSISSDNLINQIKNNETKQLFDSFNNSEQAASNTLTYGMMLNRNQTIQNIASEMNKENTKINKGGARDTFSRQSEINEWSAQNKFDTLFFLQTTFIYFCVLVISLYFRQYGLFPDVVLYIIGGFGLLILIGILWNRASYTSISRDKRYWNRRYLGLDDSALESKLVCALGTS